MRRERIQPERMLGSKERRVFPGSCERRKAFLPFERGFEYERTMGSSGIPIRRTIPVIGQDAEENGWREMVSLEGREKNDGNVISRGPLSLEEKVSSEEEETKEKEEKALGASICI